MKPSSPVYNVIADLARIQKVKMITENRCKMVIKATARHYGITTEQLIEIITEQFNEWK